MNKNQNGIFSMQKWNHIWEFQFFLSYNFKYTHAELLNETVYNVRGLNLEFKGHFRIIEFSKTLKKRNVSHFNFHLFVHEL